MSDPSIVDSTRAALAEYLLEPTASRRKDLITRYEILWQPHYIKTSTAIRKELAHTLGISPSNRLKKRMDPSRKHERRVRAGLQAVRTRRRNGRDEFFSTETQAAAGRKSTHLRWHVARHQTNPRCEHCIEENRKLNPEV
jgi:hypothetical protein